MKVGDLVYFKSGFEPFAKRYESKNPGVVINIRKGRGWDNDSTSIEVFWVDGTSSFEHDGYINLYEENDNHVSKEKN